MLQTILLGQVNRAFPFSNYSFLSNISNMSNQSLRQGLVYNGPWLVADLIMLLSYILFVPKLSAFFSQKSFFHGGVVTLVYLIFCASVVLIRKLPGADSKKTEYSGTWPAFFALTFGIFITFIIAETAGFFTRLDSLPGTIEGRAALLVLTSIVLWLLLAFLDMIVVLVNYLLLPLWCEF